MTGSFKNTCTCGGYAWSMNGRDKAQPHMDYCPQRDEYAVWWESTGQFKHKPKEIPMTKFADKLLDLSPSKEQAILDQNDVLKSINAVSAAGHPIFVMAVAPATYTDSEGGSEFSMGLLGGFINTSTKEVVAESMPGVGDDVGVGKIAAAMLMTTSRAVRAISNVLNKAAAEGNTELFRAVFEMVVDLEKSLEEAEEDASSPTVH